MGVLFACALPCPFLLCRRPCSVFRFPRGPPPCGGTPPPNHRRPSAVVVVVVGQRPDESGEIGTSGLPDHPREPVLCCMAILGRPQHQSTGCCGWGCSEGPWPWGTHTTPICYFLRMACWLVLCAGWRKAGWELAYGAWWLFLVPGDVRFPRGEIPKFTFVSRQLPFLCDVTQKWQGRATKPLLASTTTRKPQGRWQQPAMAPQTFGGCSQKCCRPRTKTGIILTLGGVRFCGGKSHISYMCIAPRYSTLDLSSGVPMLLCCPFSCMWPCSTPARCF